MFKTDVFHEIFVENPSGKKYYIIDNGYKVWIVPAKNMKKGYGIYQVSSFRGKLIKNILPILKQFKIVRKLAKCEIKYLSLSEDVTSVINKYYNSSYQCSVYYGNLDNEQNYKATMQIYNENKTFGYIKATNSDVVREAIDREINGLNYLHEKGIYNIPKCVGCCDVGKWTFFVQDTKNDRMRTTFQMKEAHWNFLKKIYDISNCQDKYENCDIYKYIKYLREQIETNRELCGYDILKKAVDKTDRWLSEKQRKYCFAHGDFTPWNMYCTNDDIYVFDFEYCMNKAIPFMDYFHYICQVNIIVYNMDVEKTLKEYYKDKGKLLEYLDAPNAAFVGYLLFIISFYIMRKKGNYDTGSRQFLFRVSLLKRLLEEV